LNVRSDVDDLLNLKNLTSYTPLLNSVLQILYNICWEYKNSIIYLLLSKHPIKKI